MKEIKIQSLEEAKVEGIRYHNTGKDSTWKENYFEWTSYGIETSFKSKEIKCGLLEGWHHTPVFDVIEYHEDKELFWFYEGNAVIMFCDIVDGKGDASTAKIVRIPEGTELEIEAGKGHFVAVAEGEHYKTVVISPNQDAPRLPLSEVIIGI